MRRRKAGRGGGAGGGEANSAAKKDGSRAGGSKTVAKNGWKFGFGVEGWLVLTIKTPEAFGFGGL